MIERKKCLVILPSDANTYTESRFHWPVFSWSTRTGSKAISRFGAIEILPPVSGYFTGLSGAGKTLDIWRARDEYLWELSSVESGYIYIYPVSILLHRNYEYPFRSWNYVSLIKRLFGRRGDILPWENRNFPHGSRRTNFAGALAINFVQVYTDSRRGSTSVYTSFRFYLLLDRGSFLVHETPGTMAEINARQKTLFRLPGTVRSIYSPDPRQI